MKTIIIYSSRTGNTKKVAEEAARVLACKAISAKEAKTENLENYEKVVLAFWVDKGSINAEAKKVLKEIKGKKVFFLGTLGAAPDSFHGEKCYKNAKKLCEADNDFQAGILIRGKVADELKEKMNRFPLNMIHKMVPQMKESIAGAEGHPNEEDLKIVADFFQNYK